MYYISVNTRQNQVKLCTLKSKLICNKGGHRPGKHGKPGKLREFEKLSKSQGKLRETWIFVEKTWKTQGKCGICGIIANENVFQRIILSGIAQGKVWKWPGNLRENSGNLVTQKCGHPGNWQYQNFDCHSKVVGPMPLITILKLRAWDQKY